MANPNPNTYPQQGMALLMERAQESQIILQRSGYMVSALTKLLYETLEDGDDTGEPIITDYHRGALLLALQEAGHTMCKEGERMEDLLVEIGGGAA